MNWLPPLVPEKAAQRGRRLPLPLTRSIDPCRQNEVAGLRAGANQYRPASWPDFLTDLACNQVEGRDYPSFRLDAAVFPPERLRKSCDHSVTRLALGRNFLGPAGRPPPFPRGGRQNRDNAWGPLSCTDGRRGGVSSRSWRCVWHGAAGACQESARDRRQISAKAR